MTETCKICRKEFNSGIWLAPQFDEKVLLFCSEKCRNKYIKMKLKRIKSGYPKFYDKLIKLSNTKDLMNIYNDLLKIGGMI